MRVTAGDNCTQAVVTDAYYLTSLQRHGDTHLTMTPLHFYIHKQYTPATTPVHSVCSGCTLREAHSQIKYNEIRLGSSPQQVHWGLYCQIVFQMVTPLIDPEDLVQTHFGIIFNTHTHTYIQSYTLF